MAALLKCESERKSAGFGLDCKNIIIDVLQSVRACSYFLTRAKEEEVLVGQACG